jgi:glycosyltransferase involved in cell wall biosynthesis
MPAMKRIAVDGHILSGLFQGSRTYLENILACLGRYDRRNRYDIYSFAPDEVRRRLDFANFTHRRISIEPAIPRLLLFWPYAKLRYGFDALLTQYILPPLVLGQHLVVMHDILPVTHPQLFPPLMRWRSQRLFRHSARRARDIFVVSEYSRRAVIEHFGVPEERVHLTYNGFDATAPNVAPSSAATPSDYLLFVGRLEPRKNVDLLIRALDHVTEKNLRLIIVGRQAFAPAPLLALIRNSPKVEHLQDIDAARLDSLYRSARILVYPSSAEGFGLPVIEALARRIPVITSNQTALPEVGGPFARYLDPTAPDAVTRLAALIDEAWHDPPRPEPAALAAHLARFDWERSARTILSRIDALA